MRRKFIALFISIIILYVLFLNQQTIEFSKPIYDYLINNGFNDTSSENLVTSVYLYYRYYDTLFEALLLIVSVIAIIYLSIHKEQYHD
jgi:multicomponent Na+:H+ antiporter subunit B